jgi:hypothetical protein
VAASLALLSLCTALRVNAQAPWAPVPNVADDTGNWSSSVYADLRIRLDGFTGYFTQGFFGLQQAKAYHPQHIVRLPNIPGCGPGQQSTPQNPCHADGKTRAYFAITQSNIFRDPFAADLDVTDGIWMVAEIDWDAYDPVTDRIRDTQGSDGRYVYEEHFNDNITAAKVYYTPEQNAKGLDAFVLADAGGHPFKGDWVHPAKMSAFGGVMLMVGQNWSPVPGCTYVCAGDSEDAVLFYDVRDPRRPAYLGKLDAVQLGIPPNGSGKRAIDAMALARFENGYYHLGVMTRSFVCHESADCFNNPTTGKWIYRGNAAPSQSPNYLPGGLELNSAQQGDVYHSRETYAAMPAPGEPCYRADGTLMTAGAEDVSCVPAGSYRAMFMSARADSVLPNSFLFLCDIGIDATCQAQDANRQGIPQFRTLAYNYYLGTGTALSLTPTTAFAGAYLVENVGNLVRQPFTQMQGDCAPGGGIHVSGQNEALIYCVSENEDQPFGCGDSGDFVIPGVELNLGDECNSLYQNAPGGSPEIGAIRFKDAANTTVTYRGRGLRDMRFLSEPPWGPGRVSGDAHVGWTGAARGKEWGGTAPLQSIEILTGTWMLYGAANFGGQPYILGPGTYSVPTYVNSFRVLPPRGISLFEHSSYGGRMVSSVRSNHDLSRACGDSYEVCASLLRDYNCDITDFIDNLVGEECEYPRSFNDKTSSYIVSSNVWSLYNNENFDPSDGRIDNNSKAYRIPAISAIDSRANDQTTGVQATLSCPEPTLPIGLQYEIWDRRPLITWAGVPGALSYEVRIVDSTGATVRQDLRTGLAYVPATALPPGAYTATVRAAFYNSFDQCAPAWADASTSAPLALTIPTPPLPPVQLTITQVTADPTGLGNGSIAVSQPPASELGGSFYAPGTMLTLTATPAASSEFVSWAGDAASCGASPTCDITMTTALSVQAVFRPKPRLLVEKRGLGTVSAAPPGVDCANGYVCYTYATGTGPIGLTATPGLRSAFTGWTGPADCSDASVTMDVSKTCTANFTTTDYLLEVTSSGNGTVSGSDLSGAISCDPQSQSCTEIYSVNDVQTVTLQASAANGFQFVRWYGAADCWSSANGNGLNASINVTAGSADVSCNAMFVEQGTEYALTVEKFGVGANASTVTATLLPSTGLAGIDCPLRACTQKIPVGQTVRLTATPVRGARFDGWDGAAQCASGANGLVTEVVMTSSMTCQARFNAKILLVDGSNRTGLVGHYVSALNAVDQDDLDYDEWSVSNPGSTGNPGGRTEPTTADLASYSRVIWFTGDASVEDFSPTAGPSPAAEASLATFLVGGGCLMLSSSQYNADRGLTSFAQSYLGVSAVSQVTPASIAGAGSLPGFSGLGSYNLTNDQNLTLSLSDALVANTAPGTDVLLTYGAAGAAAIGRDNGVYRTAYLGFPFMALPSGEGRNTVMRTFMDFCLQVDRDDKFEVNDDGETGVASSDFTFATGLQGDVDLTNLKILPGNDDFFRWQADANALTSFVVGFGHAGGDLTLALYDNALQLVATAQSSDDDEVINRHVSAGDLYFLRVYGENAATNNYTLSIAAGPPDFDGDGVADALDVFPQSALEQFDSDYDSIGNNGDFDDDGDGMSDAYENAHGLNSQSAADASQDPDGDGFANLEESLVGSDPQNAASVPPAPPQAVRGLWLACEIGGACQSISLPFIPLLLEE